MKLYLSLISPVIIYSAFMLYKTPTVADGIVAAVLGLIPCIFYFIDKKFFREPRNEEIDKLHAELQIEKMKAEIEETKQHIHMKKAQLDAINTQQERLKNIHF
jgi:hypothetical protein